MSRAKFIRLSGWGLVLAAIFLLFSWLPDAKVMLNGVHQAFEAPATSAQYNLFQSLIESLRSLSFPVAILFIALGLVGLHARHGEQAGFMAKKALMVGVAGGAAGCITYGLMLAGFVTGRPLLNISMAFMFAGLFIFGLATLWKKSMPRGNGLPVLAGVWWPALVIQAYLFPQISRPLGPVFPAWLSFTIFFAMSFFLAWLGYVLQADVPNERPDDNPSDLAPQTL